MGSRSWYIKVYYLGMIILFVLGILSGFDGPMDVVNALVSAFAFVGAYGFLARVAIGGRVFWQVFFWISVISSIAGLVLGTVGLGKDLTLAFVAVVSVVVLLWLPMFIMIWLYGFVDEEPWSNPRAET